MNSETEIVERNLAVVKKLYACFIVADWDGVVALLDPDVVIIEAAGLPYGGRYKGRDGFMKIIHALGTHYDDLKLSDFDYVASGDAVVGLFRVQARSKATGRPIDVRFSEHWRLKDGMVTLLEPFYFDTHAIREAIGMA